jgi:hypothetical protein
MGNVLLSHIIFLSASAYMFIMLRRKQFWNDKAYYKFPTTIILPKLSDSPFSEIFEWNLFQIVTIV